MICMLQFFRTWTPSLTLWGAGAGVTALYVRFYQVTRGGIAVPEGTVLRPLASVCHASRQARFLVQGASGTSQTAATL